MRGAEALALAGDTLLVKDGYSYGPPVGPPDCRARAAAGGDQCRYAPDVAHAGGRPRRLDRIVTPEESQVLRVEAGPAGAGLRQVVFADISAGQTRHLYCNRSVPDAWLARIDQALAAQARAHPP